MIRSLCAVCALLGALALGCSLRYSPDDLRGVDSGAEGTGTADAAASGDAGGGSADAAPAADAASPADAAPAECEIPGDDCGDEFIECTEDLTCEPCGHRDEPCCQEGPQCVGLVGLVCTGPLCL